MNSDYYNFVPSRCIHDRLLTEYCCDCASVRAAVSKEPTTFRGSYLSAAGYHVCYECAGHDDDHLPWCKTGQREKAKEPVYFPPSRIDEKPVLPTDSAVRKGMPITSGVLHYFPRALAYVSMISKFGNDKHNPGEPLHWAKEKSFDQLDCCARHLADAGKRGDGGYRETGYLAWRALAALDNELEAAEARGEKW